MNIMKKFYVGITTIFLSALFSGANAQDYDAQIDALQNELLKINVIDSIIKEPIGGAHRNKEQVILHTKMELIKQLEEFKNYSREETFEQRKKKFLEIGRQKSFTSFSQNFGNLVEKENFISLLKENFIKFKNKLIIGLILFLVIALFVIK